MLGQEGNNAVLLHKDRGDASMRILDEDVPFSFVYVCVCAPVDW